MAGAILNRDAGYIANVKADIIETAERLLLQKYAAIAVYGAFALFLFIGAVYACYKIYVVVFRYKIESDMTSAYGAGAGDDVNDPKHDDEARREDPDAGASRVPSGNQIRNRISRYSKLAGRDLRADFDVSNDEYVEPAPKRDDGEDDD